VSSEQLLPPLQGFRFHVRFRRLGSAPAGAPPQDICSGAFSDCSGLEATMEPKVIKAGGMNYGAVQRAGPVSFATVILKRGMTRTRDLATWFQFVAGGAYAFRMAAEIEMHNAAGEPQLTWGLVNCLPVKFKAGELSARSHEVAVEELHLAHEGLSLLKAG
jgi:phage tail-like protein